MAAVGCESLAHPTGKHPPQSRGLDLSGPSQGGIHVSPSLHLTQQETHHRVQAHGTTYNERYVRDWFFRPFRARG